MKRVNSIGFVRTWLLVGLVAMAGVSTIYAQTPAEPASPWLNVYGFAQLDMGHENGQIDPNWFDVMRPSKLPAYQNQFGANGNFYASIRQSRFGAKAGTPTSLGELKSIFEFELFGTGPDAGKTTFRIRHAWAELSQVGGGQTWSPFMDPDVFPNSLEYWGPPGMVFFRNIQLRWTPVQGDNRFMLAIERPGASADGGVYSDRIELQNVKAHFPYPDLSTQYRYTQPWGHVQAAGIVRRIEWKDINPAGERELTNGRTGWGINLSSNLKVTENDVIRLQYVYGEGIENYMNDAPADVAIETTASTATGKLLPVAGYVAFIDHNWSEKFSSTLGYSGINISNTNGQSPSAFHHGDYALTNLLYSPVKNFLIGAELQYGKRKNFNDGFTSDDFRVQLSVKASFSSMFGGKS